MANVYVWMSVAELRKAGACPGGIAEAEKMAEGQGRKDKIRLRWDALGSAWFWAVYSPMRALPSRQRYRRKWEISGCPINRGRRSN